LAVLRDTPHDLFYLNSTFSTYTVVVLLFARLGLVRGPVIVAPRGSLSAEALGLKSIKKRVYLTLARLFGLYKSVYWHSTSDEETRDIGASFGLQVQSHITQIPNLPMPLTLTKKISRSKLHGQVRIVMLSRISRMKNVEFIAEVLHGVHGDVTLDFWGPIEDEGYWETCLKRFRMLPANIKVAYRGSVTPDRVAEVLSQYDLFFMPSLSENFGHAILEALCAGCPVLISDRTPWHDVNEQGAGWALPLAEPERFREVVQQAVNADSHTWLAYCRNASEYGATYIMKSTAVDKMRRFLIDLASR
jgi:glycosyltransferase involved in cell wall biosynthesis